MDLEKTIQNLDHQQPVKPTERVEVIDHNVSRASGALHGKMIQDCTEEELREKLSLIFSMVGLRLQFYPAGQEKKDLHDYIFLKYGKKTLSELVLAFDLAINGELDLKPDDVKVYDQFTISYIAAIMAAYKNWLRLQTQNIKPAPMKELEDKKNLTDEEKQEWVDEWKQMPAINIELIPVLFYDFLTEKNIIKPSPREKNEYLSKAAQAIKTILHSDMSDCMTNDAIIAFNSFCNAESNGFTGPMKERILNRAKKMIVHAYLKPVPLEESNTTQNAKQ